MKYQCNLSCIDACPVSYYTYGVIERALNVFSELSSIDNTRKIRIIFYMIEKISVRTHRRNELCDITKQIQHVINKQKIKDGILHIFCPHTTAALTINENCDPAVQNDISDSLNKLIPANAGYKHAEGNADAHIKSAITGSSRTLFIEGGNISFGTWQGIYLCEFDGPRTREVWVKILKE